MAQSFINLSISTFLGHKLLAGVSNLLDGGSVECKTQLSARTLAGRTVEMHGSIKQMVCPDPECKFVVDMDGSLMAKLKGREDVPCRRCNRHSLRCRIMLYDDKDGEQLRKCRKPLLLIYNCRHEPYMHCHGDPHRL